MAGFVRSDYFFYCVGHFFFFRFLCSCHAQVGQSSNQAARMKKGKLIRGGLWEKKEKKLIQPLWLKAEKCKITQLG